MGLDEEITLTLNADELLLELDKVEARANEVENTVAKVEEESEKSYTAVIGMVHAGWLATQGMVRAAGGTISTVFRTVIGTTLGAISLLTPILTAEAVTPGMQAQAAMGFASIALALSALVAAEAQEQEFSDALRGANMALHGIQSMIGMINF